MASTLRLSRKEFWGRTSRIYDAVAGERLAAWTTGRFPPEGTRILDVGCGPGNWALKAARALPGSLVAGVDFSLDMVRRAESKRCREGISNCHFIAADAGALPFRPESFDRVRSTASLKFWPDPVGGLDEIHRVLAPGGKLLVIEAARDTPPEEIRKFLRSLGLGPVARFAGSRVLSHFLRRHGLQLDTIAEMAARSCFGGGRAVLLPGSPFFSLELSRSDDLPRTRELAPMVASPDPCPDFSRKTADGASVIHLREFVSGKPLVLVVTFAAWCRNCESQAPLLLDLHRKYHPLGLQVLLVSEYTSEAEVRQFVRRHRIPFPVLPGTTAREEAQRTGTDHYRFRTRAGDGRKWGTPLNVFIVRGDLEHPLVVAGELLEGEIDDFITRKLAGR